MNVEAIRSSPAVTALTAGPPAAALEALGLKAGDTVAVKVAAMTAEGLARLMVGGGTLEVKTDRPLTPGTTLNLTVQQDGAAVKLMLAMPATTPGAASSGPTPPSPTAQPGLPAAPAAPAPGPAASPSPSPSPAGAPLPLPPQATVAAAVVDLLARGLVPAATAQLGDGARVALAARGAPATTLAALDGETEPSPASLKVAVTEGVRAAAGRQESLATLFADLGAAGRGANAKLLPQPVANALAEVLGFRISPESLATPKGLQAALANAGTLMEARLAALPEGAPLPPDLKTALLRLRSALTDWTATLPDTSGETPKPAAHEKPPLRGALPHGQPPQPATLADGAPASELARTLTERTEAALARLTLLQAASLPDGQAPRPEAAAQTLQMEVPLRLGAETAIAQFQIQRDPPEPDERRPGASAQRGWTMRLSLDAEPLGPLHAAIRWRDGHVGVDIWAERAGTAAALDAERANLSEALEASAFAIDRLVIAEGRPPDPKPAAVTPHRLDRSS
ncbi:flagellar hook-length control protein FliK [Phreatobacter oligotrophus]|uniref:flagellar hook-length control protein FliK n=1 Tax=Phreatobacter oligotrophus TaxID=1122261 RepID=UPI002357A151|nr:flagellar hook-length control protein FliK [Phreatobacter oligotrophus]MBX9991805.1 flagellar hook-length control protein FliK [Phreatobacter oligotrophus]